MPGVAPPPDRELTARLGEQAEGALGLLVEAAHRSRLSNRASDGVIHDALVGLLLGIVFVATLAAHRGSAVDVGAIRPARRRSRQSGARRLLSGIAHARTAVGAPSESDPTVSSLLDPSGPAWLDDETCHRVLDALTVVDGDPVRYDVLDPAELGGIYEALLTARVARLSGAAVRIRPRGTWITASHVLAQPPNVRSKWLQREAGLPKGSVQRLADPLSAATGDDDVLKALAPVAASGTSRGKKGQLVVQRSAQRRSTGAHYTPPSVRDAVVERALSPLARGLDSRGVLGLRVCDPALGSGAFLITAARFLARTLTEKWRAERRYEGRPHAWLVDLACRKIVERCLYGVDANPLAVELSRLSLGALFMRSGGRKWPALDHLRVGDAVVGPDVRRPAGADGFDWARELPDVLGATDAGFDAFVGNPPWVAYVGRAAQPLDDATARHFERTNPAFRKYRTLHGVFVRRCAELLRLGGRLGLVLPTSVADLAGYEPTRLAHDALCAVDDALLDFGDGAFDDVFQPSMGLTSTRCDGGRSDESEHGTPWPLARSDLDASSERLLRRLSALPKLPAELFGERGYQTAKNDLSNLRRLPAPDPPFTVPIYEGVDIGEMERRSPSLFINPTGLTGRLRAPAEWRRVGVLIRQTARFPIAALSDGVAFRNSVLAGFEVGQWRSLALAAYLNSSPIRWFHYQAHRDARQGMPQLKIGHLRALPAPRDAATIAELTAFGRVVAERNRGLSSKDRAKLDAMVAAALGLSKSEREIVAAWARENPQPKRRVEATAKTKGA